MSTWNWRNNLHKTWHEKRYCWSVTLHLHFKILLSRHKFVTTQTICSHWCKWNGRPKEIGIFAEKNTDHFTAVQFACYYCPRTVNLEAHYRVSITNTNTQCRSVRTCYGCLWLTLRWLMSYIYIYIWSTHSWCF